MFRNWLTIQNIVIQSLEIGSQDSGLRSNVSGLAHNPEYCDPKFRDWITRFRIEIQCFGIGSQSRIL
jgi:hypothetical protein